MPREIVFRHGFRSLFTEARADRCAYTGSASSQQPIGQRRDREEPPLPAITPPGELTSSAKPDSPEYSLTGSL